MGWWRGFRGIRLEEVGQVILEWDQRMVEVKVGVAKQPSVLQVFIDDQQLLQLSAELPPPSPLPP
jgi:hypothetical protein